MQINSPALLGAVRALGVVLLMAALTWLGDATNLSGIFNPTVNAVISMLALAIEHSLAAGSGTAMFGTIRTGGTVA